MTTNPQIDAGTELDAFHRYMDERHGGSLNGHTLSEAIEEFRLYQAQLAELREKVQRSIESGERDGTIVLTDDVMEAMFLELDAELAEKGIVD